jgi:hypothetical protein
MCTFIETSWELKSLGNVDGFSKERLSTWKLVSEVILHLQKISGAQIEIYSGNCLGR